MYPHACLSLGVIILGSCSNGPLVSYIWTVDTDTSFSSFPPVTNTLSGNSMLQAWLKCCKCLGTSSNNKSVENSTGLDWVILHFAHLQIKGSCDKNTNFFFEFSNIFKMFLNFGDDFNAKSTLIY